MNEMTDLKRRAGIITEEYQPTRYPELESISKDISQIVVKEINQRVQSVESEMRYKPQHVLEELIKILQALV